MFPLPSHARSRKAALLAGTLFSTFLEQHIDLVPFLQFHVVGRSPPGALSSRWSHALAVAQSRRTVFGEIWSTSAISSTVSPPKNLNSTTRPFRGSSSE